MNVGWSSIGGAMSNHLPVVHEEELTGLVSIGDLVRAKLGESKYENRLLKDYISGVAAF